MPAAHAAGARRHRPGPRARRRRRGGRIDPVLETALVVTLDAPQLDPIYREAHPGAVARGIPFHVTILYPWVPLAELGEDDLELARSVIARHHAFGYALERIETFPGVVWLAPEPDAPFRALMSAVHAAFPGYPPYGGGHHEVIPHATLTSCAPEELDAAVARLEPRVSSLLPVGGCADAVTLLVEEELDRWRERLRFTLPE